jgi:hypothetical protein
LRGNKNISSKDLTLKKIIDTADKVIHHDVDEYGLKVLELTF